jgi:L-tyrosine isonitrile synthase
MYLRKIAGAADAASSGQSSSGQILSTQVPGVQAPGAQVSGTRVPEVQVPNDHVASVGDGYSDRGAGDGIIGQKPVAVPQQKFPQRWALSPEKVLQAFNTRAFKREQPSDPERMRQVIATAISVGAPIPFVLYWGKGPRRALDKPDIECLDFLNALSRRVREVYRPGTAVQLIFTDTHAALNGHSEQSIGAYYGAMDLAAGQRGFSCCWLGDLVRAAAAPSHPCEGAIPEDMLKQLSLGAAKWYRGNGTALEGARKYFMMNMVEKNAVELAFPDTIFITFNSSRFRCLLPDALPIFYMYSLRHGVCVKPWFLPVDPMFPAATDSNLP